MWQRVALDVFFKAVYRELNLESGAQYYLTLAARHWLLDIDGASPTDLSWLWILVMYRRLATLVFAISISALLHACSTLPAAGVSLSSDARPVLGVRLRIVPVDSLPASIAGDRPNLLKVVSLKEQYSAAQAGIQAGDILLELNEIPVSGMADSVAIVQQHAWGEAVLVTVLRDQAVYRIPVLLSKTSQVHNRAVEQSKDQVVAGEKINAVGMSAPASDSQAVADNKTLVYTPPVLEVAAMSVPQQERPAVEDRSYLPGQVDVSGPTVHVVIDDHTVVYPSPSFSTSPVTTLDRYELVSSVDREGDWLRIETARGLTGFVHLTELSVPGTLSQRVVLARYTNVRKGPGQSYDIVASLDRHHVVTVLEDGEHWLRIEKKDNPEISGYVHASLLGAQPVLQ